MKNIDKYIVQPNSFLILKDISFWKLGWFSYAKENNCIGLLEIDEEKKVYRYSTISRFEYPLMEDYSSNHYVSFKKSETALSFAESHVKYHSDLMVNIF